MRARFMGWAVAAVLLAAAPASAATLHFATTLKGADEVPANTTKGTGKVSASLDTATKVFSYKVTYSGLTGPATMAHFHGPAAPGANAGPVVPVPTSALADPMKGTATLTDAQIADLEAGNWYFNIHTAANPGGEIRGQLPAKK
jgi:CHRD domain